jgi:hypothetical protein
VQQVQIEATTSLGSFKVSGTTNTSSGRKTKVDVTAKLKGMDLSEVVSHGADDPTLADQATSAYILRVLQSQEKVFTNPWAQTIFGQLEDVVWPSPTRNEVFPLSPVIMDPDRPLNSSQLKVVTTMLSPPISNQIMLVQGEIITFSYILCSLLYFRPTWDWEGIIHTCCRYAQLTF